MPHLISRKSDKLEQLHYSCRQLWNQLNTKHTRHMHTLHTFNNHKEQQYHTSNTANIRNAMLVVVHSAKMSTCYTTKISVDTCSSRCVMMPLTFTLIVAAFLLLSVNNEQLHITLKLKLNTSCTAKFKVTSTNCNICKNQQLSNLFRRLRKTPKAVTRNYFVFF